MGNMKHKRQFFTIQGLIFQLVKLCMYSDNTVYTQCECHQLSRLSIGNQRKAVAFLLNKESFLDDMEFEVGLKRWFYLNCRQELEGRGVV